MRRQTAGLTLIELLIGLALIGVMLAALLSLNLGTSRASAALQVRNDLMPELQVAQNYMAGKLREAVYVFPAGSSFVLATSGNTLKDPTGSYNWNIGTDPMVAFVVPPKTVSAGQCALATSSTVSQYCYAFYAFYAIKRSDLVAATGSDNRTNNPGADPGNDSSSWVLMEYRGYYTTSVLGYAATGYSKTLTNIPGATSNGGSNGRLLADYMQPMMPVTGVTPMFTAPSNSTQTAGQTSITINIAARESVPGQTVNVPTTGFNTLTVYPRNVGKTDLTN